MSEHRLAADQTKKAATERTRQPLLEDDGWKAVDQFVQRSIIFGRRTGRSVDPDERSVVALESGLGSSFRSLVSEERTAAVEWFSLRFGSGQQQRWLQAS